MNGHRVRGTISGIVFGLGLVILLQQFGVVPLTTLVLILVPLGSGLVGLAIGWPRRARSSASAGTGAAGPG
jgi:hypothetical protein